MKITLNEIGKEFALHGVKDHTYTLVWYSQTVDRCGVIPSWSRKGWVQPMEYTVRTSSLRPLTFNQ